MLTLILLAKRLRSGGQTRRWFQDIQVQYRYGSGIARQLDTSAYHFPTLSSAQGTTDPPRS